VLMEQYANDKRVNIPYQLRSTTGTPIKFRACETRKPSCRKGKRATAVRV